MAIVFQDPDDQLFMPSVREDVAFGPANLGLRAADLDRRVYEALDEVDMAHCATRPPHHLSFGERRRVAIATVLAMQPDVLVLDEPSSNLDPAARREVADILKRLQLTTLVVTHDLPYALELCERSVILNNGSIVADGPTAELLCDRDLMAAIVWSCHTDSTRVSSKCEVAPWRTKARRQSSRRCDSRVCASRARVVP